MLAPTVKDLNHALRQLVQWYELGVELDVEKPQLDMILQQYSNHGVPMMRIQMLEAWLKSEPTASWDHLVAALKRMGQVRVAIDIERKHCSLRPHQTGNSVCVCVCVCVCVTVNCVEEQLIIIIDQSS